MFKIKVNQSWTISGKQYQLVDGAFDSVGTGLVKLLSSLPIARNYCMGNQ